MPQNERDRPAGNRAAAANNTITDTQSTAMPAHIAYAMGLRDGALSDPPVYLDESGPWPRLWHDVLDWAQRPDLCYHLGVEHGARMARERREADHRAVAQGLRQYVDIVDRRRAADGVA